MSKNNGNPISEISSGDNHIRCDVKNCTFHTTNDCCSASTIHVQSCTSADRCSNCEETACSTFMRKAINN